MAEFLTTHNFDLRGENLMKPEIISNDKPTNTRVSEAINFHFGVRARLDLIALE